MMPMFTLEPTEKNIDYVEKVSELYMDYAHHFISDEELEEELRKLRK